MTNSPRLPKLSSVSVLVAFVLLLAASAGRLTLTSAATTSRLAGWFGRLPEASAKSTVQHPWRDGGVPVAIHAAGKGTPWLTLGDGISVPTSVTDATAEPVALGSADFDGDGVADLVTAYGTAAGGALAVSLGNVDALYPNAPEAQARRAAGTFTDSPFHGGSTPIALVTVPDLVATGDFDNDGHADVVLATVGGNALVFLKGDGHGAFARPVSVPVAGAVTTLGAGEIDAMDSLDDLVVAVTRRSQSSLLVFNGDGGAIQATPESIALPGPATSLAFGQLDARFEMDVAASAGGKLVIVHGRSKATSNSLPPVLDRLETVPTSFRVASVAAGNFVGDATTELALLGADGAVRLRTRDGELAAWGGSIVASKRSGASATLVRTKMSTLPHDDLVVVDAASSKLDVLLGDGDPNRSANAPRVGPSSAPVELASDGAPVAVLAMRLNSDALSDLVTVRRGDVAPVVVPTVVALTLTVDTVADGSDNNPGDGVCSDGLGNCTLRAAIEEANANSGADEIDFAVGSGAQTLSLSSPLTGLGDSATIDATTQPGYSGTPLITIDGTGLDANGVRTDAGDVVLRGLNVRSFTGNGIFVTGSTNTATIEGCTIGTNAGGTAAAGNAIGVFADRPVTIGGTTAAARNVISGNVFDGVSLSTGADNSAVKGNYIGTNAGGSASVSNGTNGIRIDGASFLVIGGDATGRNVISGNTTGADLSNGVFIENGASSVQVLGNYIGLAADGSTALGNGAVGVADGGSSNQIGSSAAGMGNVISANGGSGVRATGVADGPTIQGNFIGTDAAGTAARGNSLYGVNADSTNSVDVGGDLPGEGNVIASNGADGVVILTMTFDVTVKGNKIGIGSDLGTILPNLGDGVFVENGSFGVTITGNNIAENSGNAVTTFANTGTVVTNNAIYDNGGLGIDYGNNGPTPNDAGDADGIPNFPVLVSAAYDVGMGTTSISGSLSAAASQTYSIDIYRNSACDASGFGEGQVYLGTVVVATDAMGNSPMFASAFVDSPSLGNTVTATASLLGGGGSPQGLTPQSTSEFSACVPIDIPIADLSLTGIAVPGPVMPGQDVAYSVQVTNGGPDDATNALLTTATPPSTTFVSLSVPAGWTPTTPPAGGTGAVTATRSSLAPSDGVQNFTLVVKVNPSAPGGTNVSASFSVSSDTLDPDNSNNGLLLFATVAIDANLGVTISDAPDPVAPTGNITYTVTVTNAGPDPAMDLNFTFGVPANTTFVSVDQPAQWGCKPPPVGGTGTLVCFASVVAVSDPQVFTIVVNVDAATPDGTMIPATAMASAMTPDSVPSNNTANATTLVSTAVPIADLGVTKSASPDTVLPGGEITYTVNLTNNGPASSSGVAFTDAVPANTTFVSATVPPGFTSALPPVGGTGTIAMTNGTLGPISGVLITIVVRVDTITPPGTIISNTASVAASGSSDPNATNDSATATTTVGAPAIVDLTIELSATPDPVAPSGTITYTIVGTNLGTGPATDVAISNVVPSGTTFVSAMASTGGTFTSPAPGGTGTVTFLWSGATEPGESRTATLIVEVNASTADGSMITDSALVSSANVDIDSSNNAANVSTSVEAAAAMSADLSITSTSPASQIDTGTLVTYTITVTNHGPGTAEDVVVQGSTPNGTRLVSIDSTQGQASGIQPGGQGAFQVDIGDMDANKTVTVTVVVNVVGPGGTTFSSAFAVSSNTNDPIASNNMTTSGTSTVVAGNDTLLTWDPPLPCDDDCLNPPLHLQTSTPTPPPTPALPGQHVLRNDLLGYNVYRSNTPNVTATPSNFFTTVPPSVTTLVAPTAPGGSFFTVTAVYPNGESSETNAASGGIPEPQITGFKIGSGKVNVLGTGFTDSVQVFIDGIPFNKPAKVKKDNTRVTQKGKLLTGQTVQQYLQQQGGVVLVSVLNTDTGIGTFLYRR